MSIGVLDIQGSVEEHLACLERCGVKPVAVKSATQIEQLDGLIIPGGESTTIGDLMKEYGLDKTILARQDLAIWGTCAGAIIMAQLGLLDIEVERNAYGGQMESFEKELILKSALRSKLFPGIFIRAPRITSASNKANILAQYDGSPVMVQQGNRLVTTFHPELTDDLRIHQYFIDLCRAHNEQSRPHAQQATTT